MAYKCINDSAGWSADFWNVYPEQQKKKTGDKRDISMWNEVKISEVFTEYQLKEVYDWKQGNVLM